MKERPILFSGAMVRAILEGRKTQTRRVIKRAGKLAEYKLPYDLTGAVPYESGVIKADGVFFGPLHCPYGKPGDRLWVRESGWEPPCVTGKMLREGADTWPNYFYSADSDCDSDWLKDHYWKRRPSIHMPRWASRITLEITGIRVERLQDISEEDADAEGAEPYNALLDIGTKGSPRLDACAFQKGYALLWGEINGQGSWSVNPWVWVIEFRRVK